MKKKITAIALVICLLAVAVVGGTMAYFTDEDEATNVFTMGNVDIVLDEAAVTCEEGDWIVGNDRVHENEYDNLYPGAVLPKDPTVHNEGSLPAYVRVKVTVDSHKLAGLQADNVIFDGDTEDADLLNIIDGIGEGWTYVAGSRKTDTSGDSSNVTYTYNYNTALAVDADTSALFKEVEIPTYLTQEDVKTYGLESFQIHVVAEAIQADMFADVTAAFAAYDAE